MDLNLYDSQGYEIKLEMTKTFNPSKAGVSGDIRDLGVLVSFLGAAEPEYEGITYEKDPLCVQQAGVSFPCGVELSCSEGFLGAGGERVLVDLATYPGFI